MRERLIPIFALTNKVKTAIFSPPLRSLDVWTFEWRAYSSFKEAWNQISLLTPSVLLLPLLLLFINILAPILCCCFFFFYLCLSKVLVHLFFSFHLFLCVFFNSISIHLAPSLSTFSDWPSSPTSGPVTWICMPLELGALVCVWVCVCVCACVRVCLCAHINIFMFKYSQNTGFYILKPFDYQDCFHSRELYLINLPWEILHSANINKYIDI